MSPTHSFRSRSVDIQHLTFDGSLAMRLVGPASDTATVLLRGGQLVSWINAQGREMLLDGPSCSGWSVAFVQQAGTAPPAYFRLAQDLDWRVCDAWFYQGVPHLSLRLRSRDMARPCTPFAFECFLDMALNSPQLVVALKVINTGAQPIQFNAAMQPCFRLDASPAGVWRARMGAESVSLPCADGRLELRVRGFQEVAVWSPWTLACDPSGALIYVQAATPAALIQLAPGAHWLGTQQMGWKAHVQQL